ncbi:MAG: GNAT family N-acetyltransferase [Candidatus Nanopelagicales bacterium]
MTASDEVWADRIADALGRAFLAWMGQSGRAQGVDGDDVLWMAGVPDFPLFNAVLATGRTVDLDALDRAEQSLSEHEPLHRLSTRAAVEPVVGPWAAAHGYGEGEPTPSLVLSGDGFTACLTAAAAGTRTRRAQPSEAAAFNDAAAGVFGLPAERIRMLTPDSLAVHPQSTLRIAVVDDRIVGTAQAWTEGEAIGVFNVAVVPEHRRTGLGAELTAAVVADGAAVGGTWAYLQSSDDGLPVYERLGFRTVDTWWSWMPQGSDDH